MPVTSPPNRATSLRRLELMNITSCDVMKDTMSTLGAKRRFIEAISNSYSKSDPLRNPRTMTAAPASCADRTTNPANSRTSTLGKCPTDRRNRSNPFFCAEQQALGRSGINCNDDLFEQGRCTVGNVHVPCRYRIKGSRIQRSYHSLLPVGHPLNVELDHVIAVPAQGFAGQ